MPNDHQPTGEPGGCSAPPACYATFRIATMNVPIMHKIMREGGTSEDCALALANENAQLYKRIMELEAIAPRKIALPDGRIYLYRCPDELVPTTVA